MLSLQFFVGGLANAVEVYVLVRDSLLNSAVPWPINAKIIVASWQGIQCVQHSFTINRHETRRIIANIPKFNFQLLSRGFFFQNLFVFKL